jgi:NAD-dependent histone deacetylase SIR2
VVVTGAGISCSSGIPVQYLFQCTSHITTTQALNIQDFRSSKGLYKQKSTNGQQNYLKLRDLFDINVFRDPDSSAQFYSLIAELKAKVDAASPSSTHRFIWRLSNERKLLRWYTQNIDGLEWKAFFEGEGDIPGRSIPDWRTIHMDTKIIRLHGDIKLVPFTLEKLPILCCVPSLASSKVVSCALVAKKDSSVGLNTSNHSIMVLPMNVLFAVHSVSGTDLTRKHNT